VARRGAAGAPVAPGGPAAAAPLPPRKALLMDAATAALLLALGTFQSAQYFAHAPAPHPDYPCFRLVGRAILSGRLPDNMKFAPVYGVLEVGLAKAMVEPFWPDVGRHPDLTAGWLVNALLHPFTLVLLWLVFRRLLGPAGIWPALLAGINPYLMDMLAQPIVETTFLFFVLLTFWLILRRSAWAYLAAAVATMVRYDGAALILAAFVIDLLRERAWRGRALAMLRAVLAGLPLLIWMAVTFFRWRHQEEMHYLKVMIPPWQGPAMLLAYPRMTWEVVFEPLLSPWSTVGGEARAAVALLGKVLAGAAFVGGWAWAVRKRRWEFLALSLFLVPYVGVHMLLPFGYPRFVVPYGWIALAVACLAVQGVWELTDRPQPAFRAGRKVFLGVLAAAAACWAVATLGDLSALERISSDSRYVPLAAAMVIVGVIVIRAAFRQARPAGRLAAVAVLAAAMVLSNQQVLADVMYDGGRDYEFKLLADWFGQVRRPGQRLAVSMPSLLAAMDHRHAGDYVHVQSVPGDTPEQFVRGCRELGISYVAWDSRIGLCPGDPFYRFWGISRIARLGEPKSGGAYEFLGQIAVNRRRWINVFRVLPAPSSAPAAADERRGAPAGNPPRRASSGRAQPLGG